jgi:3-hydroxybutyryl-CoA dehydrogenase
MKIVLLATDAQWEEIRLSVNAGDEWERAIDINNFFKNDTTDLYINLQEDAFANDYSSLVKPVLINSVLHTLKEMNAAQNVFRINGWNGFLSRNTWEITGSVNTIVKDFFSGIAKEYTIVADEPGFIAARIIATIINEAYFALGEKLSTREEIDIAMKLGTNYPYGPFEWCNKIGIKNIYGLLQKLSIKDTSYLPAPLLKQEATS